MLYQIRDGSLSAGSETVLSHFDFEIKGRERVAIVGPNGAGKTTLLRLIAGRLSLDRDDKRQGDGIYLARDTSIGLLSQEAIEDPDRSVNEEMLSACPASDLWSRQRFDYEQAYDRYFTGFGFKKEDKDKLLSEFSGGERTKIALIRLLLERPDILLLDEPTNHLDLEAVSWLEELLLDYPGAVVMVSHDRFFLDQVAQVVYEISERRLVRYAGGYSDYRREKLRKIAAQQKAYDHQQQEIARLNEVITRFKHKPTKAAMARSKKKQLERLPKVLPPVPDDAHIFTGELLPGVVGPKWVLDLEELQIGYDHVLQEISSRIRRGQKIGIIGPNGSGKTTFLKTLTGQLSPIKGKYSFGQNVEMGYFDQLGSSLLKPEEDEKTTVLAHFTGIYPNVTEKDARHYLASYLFKGAEVSKRVRDLSGGERSRLLLCELLYAQPNLLLLDEPTNHMDIPARETLESAFRAYKGTLLFVSHDRYFLQQVADGLLIFEKNSVAFYPFGYRHYLDRIKALRERIRLEKLRKKTDRSAAQEAEGATAEAAEGSTAEAAERTEPGEGPKANTAEICQSESAETSSLDQLAGLLSPEDAALAASLKRVPKGSSLLGHELSDDQIFYEWQLRLASEELQARGMALEACQDKAALWQAEAEMLLPELTAAFHESCLKWYEIYTGNME